MAFPQTPLGAKVELQLNGTWTDITTYADIRDGGIHITRGRQDESGSAQPGRCQVVLNNRDGRFSPRNPAGPYYGVLGRNTPLRVSALLGGVRMTGSGDAQAPDSAALSVVGDLDVRYDAKLPAWWGGGALATVLYKFVSPGQLSWRMLLTAEGYIYFGWSADGTNELFARSTVSVPQLSGRQAVRATIDVDNGAAGNTVTFYTATSSAGPWVQLGAPVVQAGVTSIFNSTAPVVVNTSTGWEVYSAEIRNGIGGALVGNPIFSSQAEGATSFADAQGNTWTLLNATATARRFRFYGEVSSWPQAWDLSQRDVWVPIEAAGIIRRLGQGTAPLKGALWRATLADANVRAYWPLEDAQGSTSMGSGLPGGPAMSIGGSPQLASSDVFAVSNPLPELAFGSFSGPVNTYTSTGIIHARWLMAVPAAGDVAGTVARVYTTGTAARWDFHYHAGGGSLALRAYDNRGVLLLDTGAIGFAVDGKLLAGIIELTQNGANIDYKMVTLGVANNAGNQWTGTLASRTVGAATYIQINPEGALGETVVGHVAVASAIPTSVEQPLRGYAGETAGRRVLRLCSENGIEFTGFGSLDATAAMGVQKPGQLLDLLGECEASDLGQLFESRDHLGLAYRSRDSRAIQNTPLALTYDSLSELVPIEDDQGTRNDVTVSRIDGSSARATVDVGPLSTQAPPNGVGRYDDSVSLSLHLDSQVGDQANMRVTIGTIDEPRYPSIRVDLESPTFSASSALTSSALDADHGDLITVTGTPEWLPPETVRQHTIGQTEHLGVFDYSIEYVCTPATPIGSAGLYDDGTSRYAPSGSTLTSGITSTATGAAAISITTAAGNPLWTTAAGDFPLTIVIGGERITLSAISGASSPQSATVSARSVNGVVKAHLAGAPIDIADPIYYAL